MALKTIYAMGGLECSGDGSRGRVRLGAWEGKQYTATFSAEFTVTGGYEWREGPNGVRVSVPYDGLMAARLLGDALRTMACRGEPVDVERAKLDVGRSHGVRWGVV